VGAETIHFTQRIQTNFSTEK